MQVLIIGGGSSLRHVLQSADVYASFGVNSAVMSSSNPVEHEQNMLAMNVATRDGDESIELVEPSDDYEGEQNEDSGNEDQGEEQEDPESNSEEGGDEQEGDLEPLGEPDEELTKTSADIEQYATGFTELREQALKAGLPAEVAARIESEYDADGHLSDDSYEQLAKAGYSKGFVNSFIQGQESLAKEYVSAIVRYAGGQEKFDRVVEHLRVNQPGSVDVLNDAIERQDLVAIRTVLNLGMASQTKKFGKQPERTLNRTGAPAGRVAAESSVKGFDSQADMVKAMRDSRYGRDNAYTREVEQKVIHASW